MDTHHYEVNVRWEDTRKGTLSSPILDSNITVVTPPEFKSGIPKEWSPEHLFAASANSCLMTTFLAIAENSKLEFHSFECAADATLEMVDGVYMISQILLTPIVSVYREEDVAKANRVLEKSEKACLIANSMKSKVIMQPTVEVAVAWA